MNTPLIRKARYLVLSAFVLFTSTACFNGDDGLPILSNLFNSRLVVILKGTYATDRPLEFAEINNNRIFNDADDNTAFVRNPVDNGCIPYVQPDCVPSYSDLPIFIDIGEIRLSSKNFGDAELNLVDSSESSEEFWDVVSDERQVYCNQLYSIDFSEDACFRTGGLINFVEFMNGRGALYPSRDIGAEVYYHAGIFVRAFATGWGFAAGLSRKTPSITKTSSGRTCSAFELRSEYGRGQSATARSRLVPPAPHRGLRPGNDLGQRFLL